MQFFGSGPREEVPAMPGECPRDSQIGTVRVKTPALEEQLTGAVYLGAPLCDPCTPRMPRTGGWCGCSCSSWVKGNRGLS